MLLSYYSYKWTQRSYRRKHKQNSNRAADLNPFSNRSKAFNCQDNKALDIYIFNIPQILHKHAYTVHDNKEKKATLRRIRLAYWACTSILPCATLLYYMLEASFYSQDDRGAGGVLGAVARGRMQLPKS